MILGQLAIHPTQRSEAGPPPQLLIKINLKEVKNLDVRVYYKTLRRERRWFMTWRRERFLLYDSETTINERKKKWAGKPSLSPSRGRWIFVTCRPARFTQRIPGQLGPCSESHLKGKKKKKKRWIWLHRIKRAELVGGEAPLILLGLKACAAPPPPVIWFFSY